jgi:hypothetical protein
MRQGLLKWAAVQSGREMRQDLTSKTPVPDGAGDRYER